MSADGASLRVAGGGPQGPAGAAGPSANGNGRTVPFDRGQLRGVLGRFATGITVLTAAGRQGAHGMTANSFASVSLDPPLILVCVERTAVMHTAILEAGTFAVSVLAAGQEPEARYFADKARPRGEHEFDAVECEPGKQCGAPILTGALAWLECALAAVYDGGDHSIFLGEVLEAGRDARADALLFYGGGFHRLQTGEI
jgi:flavin reductase (DIM6/NTAB) family NADH-FMN oxidoreductase RutF